MSERRSSCNSAGTSHSVPGRLSRLVRPVVQPVLSDAVPLSRIATRHEKRRETRKRKGEKSRLQEERKQRQREDRRSMRTAAGISISYVRGPKGVLWTVPSSSMYVCSSLCRKTDNLVTPNASSLLFILKPDSQCTHSIITFSNNTVTMVAVAPPHSSAIVTGNDL